MNVTIGPLLSFIDDFIALDERSIGAAALPPAGGILYETAGNAVCGC
jgi:hypothetical protein